MNMKHSHQPLSIDPLILNETADWLVKFQSGEVDENERLVFERWRTQSAVHIAAWQQAESVMKAFKQITPEIGHGTLKRLSDPDRRHFNKILGMLVVAAPSAWLLWRCLPWVDWTADYHTATGEQKALHLIDGTHLVLNTASAVDIMFSQDVRQIMLHRGEIFVRTGRDPAVNYRPFIVQTPQGTVRALGTQFSVRRFDEYTRVAVSKGAVEIRPTHAQEMILHAGEQVDYRFDGTQSFQSVDTTSVSWLQGMFIAKNIRLADLISELTRYRSGIIRCHPDVANMPVSGAFHLNDIDASLKLLEKTLPLRISSFSRYWITIDRY